MELIRQEKINQLYDIYYSLLTNYQRDIFDMYYHEDFSLNEIAELKKVSRNAIFLLLKRVVKILEDYESKMHLLDKYNKIIECTSKDEKLSSKIKKILEK